jgi:hypothetical protein
MLSQACSPHLDPHHRHPWHRSIGRRGSGAKSGSFTNGNTFRKVFGSLFPNSVIVVEGAQWKRIRGVITRAIARLDQQGLPRATSETLQAAVRDWPTEPGSSHTVQIVPVLQRATFDAFHKVRASLLVAL